MKRVVLLMALVISLCAAERIVTLSPSLSEIVFALGKGEALVGVSRYSDYPEAARNITVVGGYGQFDLEQIIALRPTLVIGQHYNQKLFAQLQHFGIETLSVRLERLREIKKAIATLSKRLHSERSEALLETIAQAEKSIKPATKQRRVLIVYGLSEELRRNTYVAGKETFFDDIITLCGHRNALSKDLLTQPVLSFENILALNPERVIILHSLRTDAQVDVAKGLAAWRSMPIAAAKENAISVVSESYVHLPSHRVAQSIERLCREMNGD